MSTEVFGLNELQWMFIAISLSGIFFNIVKYIGICDAIDFFNDKDL